jgi:hypothetical protein
MPRSTPITLKGKTYTSHRAAALALGINPSTVNRRQQAGYSPNKAFFTPKWAFVHSNYKSVRVNGHRYPSVAQACASFGLSRGLFQQRRLAGWSVIEALTTPKGTARANAVPRTPPFAVQLVINNVRYPSIRSAALARGLAVEQVYQRVRRGWGLARALGIAKGETLVQAKRAPQASRQRKSSRLGELESGGGGL